MPILVTDSSTKPSFRGSEGRNPRGRLPICSTLSVERLAAISSRFTHDDPARSRMMSIQLPGYEIEERLHESLLRSIYRATRVRDGAAVVIKALSAAYPRKQDLAELRREYEIAADLQDVDGVITVHALRAHGAGNLAIVMEPFGISLAELLDGLDGRSLPLARFLDVSVRIARIVGALHQRRIVHKDLVPRNILIDPKSNDIRIIDFGISSELSRERQDVALSKRLGGSLPYISPEQTGRMNRDVDYRSDYYSLGVTFFELLTGQLPFQADNVLEWVHSHISKPPSSPREIDSDIPEALSGIVLKLMNKNAEDRYQSSFGLISDLERCREQLERTGEVRPFELGRADVSQRFRIPQALYGREAELAELTSLFEDVAAGTTELCLVSGYSGVGKSALVNELSKSIVREKGYLIQGKFDQFQHGTAYAAIAMAFRGMMLQLLAEPEEQLDGWRRALLEALEPNGQILVELLPELELIIGPQPAVPELPPTEAQNRFQIAFLDLVKVIAAKDHPLVVFLDDLQWSDAPTLDLLRRVVTSREMSHLLVIGAYRSNEVATGHPLSLTLDEIAKTKELRELPLRPLDRRSVDQLTADTLRCDIARALPLSELLFEKAEGNPFFLNELLKSLHDDDAIRFEPNAGRWTWDVAAVRSAELSGNVVELMVANLRRLPRRSQDLLQLAACIGNHFDLKTLSIIAETSMQEAGEGLLPALQRNMVLPMSESYKFVARNADAAGDHDGDEVNPAYEFQHDRVQQAAYALIDDELKQSVHLSIGRSMLQHSSEQEREERLIEIVGHLNQASKLLDDGNERRKLARLNLQAGVKAQHSSAYASALLYLQTGLALLPERPWQADYELTLGLNTEYQQCMYLTGRYTEADDLIDVMFDHATSALEKAEILSIRTRQYATMGKMPASIAAAIEGLSILGMDFPATPSEEDVDEEVRLVDENLAGRPIAHLIDAPPLSAKEHRLALRLLMEIFPAAFLSGSGTLFPYLVLKAVNLSLRHGNTTESAFAYAAYGMLLCGGLNQPALGYEYGKLAVNMNDRLDDIGLKSRVIYVYAMFIHHWSNHWSSMTPWFKKGIESGYQSGDLLYLAYSAQDCVIWDPKLDLETASKEQQKYLTIVKDTGYQDSYDSGTLFLQMQLNFQGLTDGLYSMNTDSFDEQTCVDGMLRRKFMTGVANYHIYKTEIYAFYGNYEAAKEHIRLQDQLIASSMSLPQLVRYTIVAFLTLSALHPGLDPADQQRTRTRLERDLERMAGWAENCTDNFLHLQYLMQAELARLDDDMQGALILYEKSIDAAKMSGFLRDEAVANEAVARYLRAHGMRKAAEGYLRAAHYLYYRWGARRKVEHMEQQHPQLLRTHSAGMPGTPTAAHLPALTINTAATTATTQTASRFLDLTSVLDASRAILRERVLERLLSQLLTIAIKNAGAQRALLILDREGELLIEAESSESEVRVLHSTPVQGNNALCSAIVNLVARTRKAEVVNDATRERAFAEDGYVVENRPKSILCMPLVNQGRLTALLYLENNLSAGTFTRERLDVLQLLSSEMAISIDNARLLRDLESANETLEDYSHTLERRVEERTLELADKNLELERTLERLQKTQERLIQQEKLASLGTLTAGIAHEMRNPLNFITNFSSGVGELVGDLSEVLDEALAAGSADARSEIDEICQHLSDSSAALVEQGRRAGAIVDTMLLHTRTSSRGRTPTDINEMLRRATELARQSMRAKDSSFDIEVHEHRDESVGEIVVIPQDIERAFINLVDNACYATYEKQRRGLSDYRPMLWTTTKSTASGVRIEIRDNGVGIPADIREQVFIPFFTTKPTGVGIGLGLSLCYDIVVIKHGGDISFDTLEGSHSAFTISLPRSTSMCRSRQPAPR